MDDYEELNSLAVEKIKFGEHLIETLSYYRNLEGSSKLERKINQELNFLKKVLRNKTLKKEHLQCSNLTHFSALIDVLQTIENCQSVNKVFVSNDRKVTVDIVCDDGLTWMKVIARNPKSLSQICEGDASYGVRSIVDQAEEYVECAKLYPCLFQVPKIIFVFVNGIGSNIVEQLESYGVIVQESITSPSETMENTCDLTTKNINNITKVNLDVSAMLAYCSSVTNGSANLYEFSVPVLKQQAAWERLRPIKPILDNFFKNKKLYCCETAKTSFEDILNTVGGPMEKVRANELLAKVTVLPDDATDDADEDNGIFNKVQFNKDKVLSVGGKIRKRSLIIFTFGDRIRAVTVTSNDGFVRAAKQQGINFVVFVHESRALTEQKEESRGQKIES